MFSPLTDSPTDETVNVISSLMTTKPVDSANAGPDSTASLTFDLALMKNDYLVWELTAARDAGFSYVLDDNGTPTSTTAIQSFTVDTDKDTDNELFKYID